MAVAGREAFGGQLQDEPLHHRRDYRCQGTAAERTLLYRFFAIFTI